MAFSFAAINTMSSSSALGAGVKGALFGWPERQRIVRSLPVLDR